MCVCVCVHDPCEFKVEGREVDNRACPISENCMFVLDDQPKGKNIENKA